jgi:hypothetical protein
LGENTNTIKKNTADLIGARREDDLETNTEKPKHIVMPCHQNPGQNRNLLIANISFENVANF